METKEILIDCPCCKARLSIDARTHKVMRWSGEQQLDSTGKPVVTDEDWNAAEGKVKGRLGEAEGLFQAGLERERGREKDLDDLFRKASEKLKKDDGEDG
jgi:hypothetical protein